MRSTAALLVALTNLAAVATAAVLAATGASAQGLSSRVLFAGTPDCERTREFEALLGAHFTSVVTTDYQGFDPALASDFEVVVLDWDARLGDGTNGLPPRLPQLPASWDRATVLVGAPGLAAVAALESKLVNLCTCLEHAAHDVAMEHPILAGPLPVVLDAVEIDVPPSYRAWPGGESLGATLPAWRVQTLELVDGAQPGAVADPLGFLDSPDAEIVASGLNSKGPRSIAIARHGSLVLWGFQAPPSQLTESARAAFVNTVAWASLHDRAPRLVRRVAPSRDELRLAVLRAHGLADEHAREVAHVERLLARRAELLAARRERELDAGERAELLWTPHDPPTFEAFARERLLRWFGADLVARVGTDPAAYAAFVDEHIEQVVPAPDGQGFALDEHALALGLSNRSRDDLFEAAAILTEAREAGDEARAAQALAFLQRATLQDFATEEQWLAWLEPREERLFHSDVGGHRFFEVPLPPGPVEPPEPGAEKVAFAASLVEDEQGLALVVRARIAEGWHLYARVGPGSAYRATSLAAELPAGLVADGDWLRPPARPYAGQPATAVFEGAVRFRLPLTRAGALDTADLGAVSISYQVCDAQRCLAPTTVRVPVVDRRADAGG
jgi:hypothetical protein